MRQSARSPTSLRRFADAFHCAKNRPNRPIDGASKGPPGSHDTGGFGLVNGYHVLKTKLSLWAASDVSELERAPDSKTRQAVIAETVDRLSEQDQEVMRGLAEALTNKLEENATPIGLDIRRLSAAALQLGNIAVTKGIGARVQDTQLSGTVKAGDISVGTLPGKR